MTTSPSEWREVSPAEVEAWREAAFVHNVGLRGQSLDLAVPLPGKSATAVQFRLSALRSSASCNDLTSQLSAATVGYIPSEPARGGFGSLDSVGTRVPTEPLAHPAPPPPQKATASKKHRRLPSLQGLLAALVGEKRPKSVTGR